MNILRALPLAALFALTACQTLTAAPKTPVAVSATGEPVANADFVPMFNGKDLAGWHRVNGTAKYAVENGEVVGTCVPGSPNTFLRTDRADYKNFILSFDMKWDVAGNSGVQFRSAQVQPGDKGKYWSSTKDGRVYGYQCEMDPSPRAWTAGVMEEGRRAWLANVAGDAPEKKAARAAVKLNDWNHITIKAEGSHLQTWLNGVPVADFTDTAPEALKEGFFGLQVHSGKEGQVRWRNVRVLELK